MPLQNRIAPRQSPLTLSSDLFTSDKSRAFLSSEINPLSDAESSYVNVKYIVIMATSYVFIIEAECFILTCICSHDGKWVRQHQRWTTLLYDSSCKCFLKCFLLHDL